MTDNLKRALALAKTFPAADQDATAELIFEFASARPCDLSHGS